ncbi:flagellar filament capping protein FliD [Stenotrophomonas sp. SY1]|jgi:flagellar hook-associated protein 2|uniref:flagellar filament capping protein FliD n=1 Tax=Stenotrophomonas sp. SY1 TaxID=477235 RepID=UPI001E47E616|nr:flagellar filament capping protein FliD [Stenotrophomonas sp. SY1]MCD9087145.1 flagellar filament capping protein FliD [Stenotrophomonas sp. SY1]
MATSSLSTIGSGLDIPTIVAQLVAAERAPTANRINNQGTTATAKLSALGSIKSSLSTLQSAMEAMGKAADVRAYKTSVPEKSGFGATIVTDPSTGKTLAAAGSYNIEVISLAQSQKLSSGAFDAASIVGDGQLTIAWGEEDSLSVDIAPGSNLTSIAAAINSAAGGKGVNATVITANDGQHLVLNAVNAGTEGALTVTASGGNGGLSALTWDGTSGGMSQIKAPTNAHVRVDGFDRESSSNSVSDIIAGVTLDLTKAEPGTITALTITQDNEPLKTAVQAFVTAYNASVNLLKSSSAYDATTDKASVLTGDSMVRGLQQQLRGQLSANIIDLKELGLTVTKDGTLSLDASTFDKAMAKNPAAAEALVGKSGALYEGMNSILKSNLDSGTGTLVQRTDTLNKEIKKLEKQLDELDARMEKVSARYTAQFTAMDKLVSQMQSTSSYLTQQLSAMSS